MKNYIYTALLALAALLLLQACYKDLGNYDYTPIDELTIKFDNTLKTYETTTGRIDIAPVLTSTVNGIVDETTEDQYTYLWFRYLDLNKLDTLATTRILQDQVVNLAVGPHQVFYRVTNKSTGVAVDEELWISVRTNTSQGYMLLCEANGVGRLDMVSLYDDQFHPLNAVVGDAMPLLVNPFKIICYQEASSYATIPGLASPGRRAIYLLGENASERVGYIGGAFTYTPSYNIANQFMPGMAPPNFVADNLLNYTTNYVITVGLVDVATEGGGTKKQRNVYHAYATGQLYWSNPLNTIDGASFFSVSPHLAIAQTKPWMLFDEDSKSLRQLVGTASKCSPIPTDNAKLTTSWENLGKDVVFMGAGLPFSGGPAAADMKYIVVMHDPGTDKYWALRTDNNFLQENWQEMNAPGLDNTSLFAVGGPYTTDIYYTAGSKLYKYNIPQNTAYEVLDRGEEITYIGFGNHTQSGASNDIIYAPYAYMMVGSYNGSTGTLGCYTALPGTATWELYKHPTTEEVFQWTGFAKIKSVTWKPNF